MLGIAITFMAFSCTKHADLSPYKNKGTEQEEVKVEPKEEPIKAENIVLDVSEITLKQGDTKLLKATVLPVGVTESVEWLSSDIKIATVSSKGLVIGLEVGEAIITAKIGEKSCTSTVTVKSIEEEEQTPDYCIPSSLWGTYSKISIIRIGDLTINEVPDGAYSDLTHKRANISNSNTSLSIEVDQSRGRNTDEVIVVAYIDWNADGDFADYGEEVFMTDWITKGKKTFSSEINVPKDAKLKSRVRVATYYKKGNTNMEFGCGIMDSGDVRDFIYKINN